MFTRRDILTAFLGAPIAAMACRVKSPRLPDGRIVGASVERGHRVREHLDVPVAQRSHHKVVIVGGGVAGLSAAWQLQKRGEDFVLFELEDVLGGTARGGENAVSAHPWGAHYINAPMPENKAMIALLDEIGAREGDEIAEQFLCREPEERLFYRGRWYEGLYLRAGASPQDLAELERFATKIGEWVDFRDSRGRRAFAIPMATGSDDPRVTALDALSMAAWMQREGFSSPRLSWLVDYACRDDYGARPENVSAWAGIFYFAARKQTAAAESQPVVTWPDGNGRLVRHLASKVGDRARPGACVTSIVPGDKALVTGLDRDGKAFGVSADRVIFAAPQFIAPHVIRALPRRDFTYSAWMVSNLTLRSRPTGKGAPLAWDNVFYDSPSLGYVVATHQRGRDHGPTVLTHYLPLLNDRQKLLSLDYAQCADIVLSDLARAHPDIREITERVEVMRWGHAMVTPLPGFMFGGARSKAAEPWRGIHFAHSDLSGVPLFEEAFFRGISAA